MKLSWRRAPGATAALALAPGRLAHAQAYPSRPVRLIVPYSAGGGAGTPPDEFAAFLRAEMTRWAEVVKAASIKAE